MVYFDRSFRRALITGALMTFATGCSSGAISESSSSAREEQAMAPQAVVEESGIPRLTIDGAHFRNAEGGIIRFWAMNLVALFPTHVQADTIADTLRERGINLVRPHHVLRNSKDWVWGIKGNSLLTYKGNSREFDSEALERFDYLNAKLRENGIYLAMSAHFTRQFLPGDASILETSEEDATAWASAMEELNGWHWKKSFDVVKLLPVVDERCALLSEEFVRNLLEHVNPYSGLAYAEDPQVLTMELLNESSTEYAIICNNRLPEYFHQKLDAQWQAFCESEGVEPGDIYEVQGAMKDVRARFLRKLDEDYFLRMKRVIAATGSTVPVTFSNLWRGDNVGAMHAEHADWIENHIYADPRVTDRLEDAVYLVSRTALAGKPFFIGELNQAEGRENIDRQQPYRTMLQASMVAYGLLQDWDGLVWFAWNHGDKNLGPEGRAKTPDREAHLGEMGRDRMMQDHLRSLGYIFRNALIQPSVAPVTIWVDRPLTAGDYNSLMRPKNAYQAGWQNIHAMRKAYGPVPEGQAESPWMNERPKSPLVSDTGEIVKDLARRQLTVAAPRVEIFSGFIDEAEPRGPKHLQLRGAGNFATVVLVSLDGAPLGESRHLLVSRTMLNPELKEIGELMKLRGVRASEGAQGWTMEVTRWLNDAAEGAPVLQATPDGGLILPAGEWTECELRLL